jgi:pyruvate/2-oxoglutarate dehydrogenase complex dihydrolipoamide acyltransferase (E2) component
MRVGSVGGTYAVPVLVMPQVCIGAIGRIVTTPRYVDANGSTDVDIDDIDR